MDSTAGPPRKKKAHDYLADFIEDVELDSKFSEQLIKLRKGLPAVRKQILRELSETSQFVPLIEATLPMLKETGIDSSERSKLVKLLDRVLQRQPSLGSASPICAVAQQLLDFVKSLLNTKDSIVQKEEALPLLLGVARIVGMKMFITALRPTFDTEDDNTRQSNATCIAAAAQTFGLSVTLPLIRVLVNSSQHNERLLGLLIVQRLPRYLGGSTLPYLHELVNDCSGALRESNLSNTANSALTSLADAVAPFGIEAFEPINDDLWTGARRRRGRPRISFLRTLSSLVPLTDPEFAGELATPVLRMATEHFSPRETHKVHGWGESDEPRLALGVAKNCINAVNSEELNQFVSIFFETFWNRKMATDRRTVLLVLWVTANLPISRSQLIGKLVESNALTSDVEEFQRMGLELLSRLNPAPLVLSHRIEERLLDGLFSSLPSADIAEDEENQGLIDLDNANDGENSGTNTVNITPSYLVIISARAISNVVAALPEDRVKVHSHTWVSTLLSRCSNPLALLRQGAVKILGNIVPFLPQSDILLVYRRLQEELGEEYPEVLSEVLNALRSVFEALQIDFENLDPSTSQVLPKLTSILRNRNERVQESCIKLIRIVLDVSGEAISAREWMHVCFELLDLQKSQRQQVRYEATATFAAISAVVGPADVVSTLLNHLRSPDRQFRITTAAAIASIAVETGPFTVLPVLLNEYSTGDTVIQHGVLKTLSFLFQFIGPQKGSPYVESITSLIDDALVDRNQVHRQTAASIVHFMAQGVVGCGKERFFIHFLNELMPSIFETSPHVIDRVLEAIKSIRQLVGVPTFSNYIWAGLFHPARKVRTIYWKIWNSLYHDDADALVPTYPVMIPDLKDRSSDIRDTWF